MKLIEGIVILILILLVSLPARAADCSQDAHHLFIEAGGWKIAGVHDRAIAGLQKSIKKWEQCRTKNTSGSKTWIDDTMGQIDSVTDLALTLHDAGDTDLGRKQAVTAESLTSALCAMKKKMSIEQKNWMRLSGLFHYKILAVKLDVSNSHLEECLSAPDCGETSLSSRKSAASTKN